MSPRLYTFHFYRRDGAATGMDAVELTTDADAARQALAFLEAHESCHQVEVWEGDRRVMTRRRLHPELQAVLSVDPPSSTEADG